MNLIKEELRRKHVRTPTRETIIGIHPHDIPDIKATDLQVVWPCLYRAHALTAPMYAKVINLDTSAGAKIRRGYQLHKIQAA